MTLALQRRRSLPSPTEALQAQQRAFAGWYLRMVCGQCGRDAIWDRRPAHLPADRPPAP